MSRSSDWLRRQSHDPFVILARKQGYNSRAAFKLEQLDDKFRVVKRGGLAVDLGASPGGWTQVLLKRQVSQVIGIDLNPAPSNLKKEKRLRWIQGDITTLETKERAMSMLDSRRSADLVVSDMLANSTGDDRRDHLLSVSLAQEAMEFAVQILEPSESCFVCKLLQGVDEPDLFAELGKHFSNVRRAKPAASRKESREIYLVARNGPK